jgi:uncharacterized protein (DUF924 family)
MPSRSETALNETPSTILAFWFGNLPDDKAVADQQSALWWKKNPVTDAAMRERFETCVRQAAAHALDHWATTPAGRLALILLTDQFPRNIYRSTPQSFAFDAQARDLCKQGLRQGDHAALRPIEKAFFYLPLEHAETIDDQRRAVALYRALRDEAPPSHRATFDGFLRSALRHEDVIVRFGRFPHRNAILGRTSTPEELVFLRQKASSF